nr:hypothetical protein [Rhizobium laguerreae]
MLIIHDDILLLLPENVLHHNKDDRLMRKSTEPTENIRPALWPARRRIAKARQIKIARSEMRIIEPTHDQHRALPRGRRRLCSRLLTCACSGTRVLCHDGARELNSPSATKLSER